MSLFAELSKRRVFATAAIYIPGAWLAVEIATAVLDRFAAPQWAGDVVVVLFLLGFPVALLLSWLFDISSDGVKRASPGTPLGIVVLLASGLFLSTGAYVSYQVFSGKLEEVRIAILPLGTSELDEGAAPYGSGIADDVRDALRELPVFRVPARTSSEAVLKAGLDIPGIAARLGVEYVLEGTLEMVGDQLDVAVALLDNEGRELWSERYRRATRDLFSLQNDLVRAVAMELGLSESDPFLQAQVREPPPTSDVEAHRLYLQGKYQPYQGIGDNPRMNALKAARLRDPGYAGVYATIAFDYALDCWIMDDRMSTSCDMAIHFAEEGLELDPGMGDAWAVLAMVRSLRYDWFGAQEAIDRFNALHSVEIVSAALPTAYFNLGRFQDAWDAMMTYYRNDPLNADVAGVSAVWAWVLLEDRELMDRLETVLLELQPQSFLGAWPDLRMHRLTREQAIEEARMTYDTYGDRADWGPLFVPIVYGDAPPESAWATLDEWIAEGVLEPAQYWWMLAYANRIDDFMDLAFELYEDRTLNAVWFLLGVINHEAIRTHPRFLELVEHIGYADYWDRVGWPRYCTLVEGERRCDGRPAALKRDS